METIEFVIHPDGRVEEKVMGIAGSACEVVTQAIEAKLGKVVARTMTSEALQTQTNSDRQSIVAYSEW
ncbi:MAG: DUF2997 domain-containing protein [Pseudanabaenaceae cyanobacterium]